VKRRPKRRRRSGSEKRSSSVRTHAKALLRSAGEALERGDRDHGLTELEAALAADPSFVEPALALARVRDEMGEDVIADALVEEAVRRGAAMLERIRSPRGAPTWWHDEATRPYMKALVARGWRRLDRDEPLEAARIFRDVFEKEPLDDPLQAGIFAAESLLRGGDPAAAVTLYEQLAEGPAVCYGRGLAFLRRGERRDATISFWLAVLLEALVARDVLGEEAFAGIERRDLVGDAAEADEIVGRIGDLFDKAARELLSALVADETFRADLKRWSELARDLDQAAPPQVDAAVTAIERFLAAHRIEAAVDAFLVSIAET